VLVGTWKWGGRGRQRPDTGEAKPEGPSAEAGRLGPHAMGSGWWQVLGRGSQGQNPRSPVAQELLVY
jgi:hypothetical protein